MKAWFVLLVLVGGVIGGTSRAEQARNPSVVAVLAADAVRLKAMMAGDGAALGKVLSERLIFVHSDGRSESKTDYIKNLQAGDTAYADARTYQVETLENGAESVVLIGVQEMRKKLGPDWSNVRLRFMAVWRNEGGTWRMLAWLSARPAGNSVVPPAK